MDASKEVSELLLDLGNGDRKALEAILPLVYEEVRRFATIFINRGQITTLQSTALVHEVYLRLADQKSLRIENRAHFLGVAAQLMRWILVDYERGRECKRGEADSTVASAPSPQTSWILRPFWSTVNQP
jgi:RNA polymerase sigma-70 factor (ECF subfamily)